MTTAKFILGLLATSAVGAVATSALADPPGRVGRVAYLEGGVSFEAPGVDDWSWAFRNYPVTSGESFWTGDDGRAELQVGGGDLRVDSETEVDIPALRYGEMRLALPQGSLNVRLWRAPEGGVTVSTPAGDVQLNRAGLYRIDVGAPTDDGSYPLVEVTAFEGAAGVPSPEGLTTVGAGEAAVLYAGYDPQLQDAQEASVDDWARDLELRAHRQARDDGAEALTGYDDLASAGEFSDDPQYGQVWYPREVPADWAPYRYGHWAYVEPWGYTWIDDQSWGFAPFHYGRWARIGGRWGWIPGAPEARPVYAPALVAFIGGAGFEVGGGGAIGWVPLGPQEVYRPTYQVSEAYVRQVNISNVRDTTIINNVTTNITINNYRNAGAATVVKAAAFSGAAPVQRAAIPVSAAAIATARPAAPIAIPAPTARARTGGQINAPASERGASGTSAPSVAARPPARIAAVRAAVVAAPTGSNKPPVIAGARIAAAPPPRPTASARPVLVAPAQAHNPAAQGRAPVPTPSSSPAARMTAPVRPLPPPPATVRPRPVPPPPAATRPPAVMTAPPAEDRAAEQARGAQARDAQAAEARAAAAREDPQGRMERPPAVVAHPRPAPPGLPVAAPPRAQPPRPLQPSADAQEKARSKVADDEAKRRKDAAGAANPRP